jgi:hypothetical protein
MLCDSSDILYPRCSCSRLPANRYTMLQLYTGHYFGFRWRRILCLRTANRELLNSDIFMLSLS